MSFTSLRRLCVAGLAALAAVSATAADFPTKPIRIIVNSGPGALLDATVRTVAQRMSENLGQPIVVENNTGGGGLLGIRQVKGAAPDGYTLLASANTLALATALRADPGYDLKDFAPISAIMQAPFLLVSSATLPDKNLAEFVARARANPDAMQYASGGIGTSTHLAAALFVSQAKLKMLHVPYRGNAGAMPDVVSGRVHMIFDGANTSGPLVKEGKLKAFGISAAKRSSAFPNLPTVAEQGFPDYSFFVYMGFVAPAGTPRDVVMRLNQAVRYALGTDTVQERFRRDSSEALPMTPEEFGEFLRQDATRAARLQVEASIPKE